VGRSAVVTGVGLLTPLGDHPSVVHDALVTRRTAFAPVELFPIDGLPARHAAAISGFAPEDYLGPRNYRPFDRTARLAACAAELTLRDAGRRADAGSEGEIGLVLGTMFGSLRTIAEFDRRGVIEGPEYVSPLDFANTVICAAAGQLAIVHGLRGANCTISCGAASGLEAIGQGARLIESGRLTAVLAGGAEEFCYESFYGFLKAGRLCGSGSAGPEFPIPYDRRRNGCVLGEGAAFVMLEDEETAIARGARIRGRIRACQSTFAVADDLAGAVETSIVRALRLAALAPADIAAISVAGSGSVRTDEREACGFGRAFGPRLPTVPATALKAALGETNGAGGALQVVTMLEAQRRGELPGTVTFAERDPAIDLALTDRPRPLNMPHVLLTSVAPEGHACALVISAN
jgi:3-oxoacyl-[acyl-carrier-protein] synthase II